MKMKTRAKRTSLLEWPARPRVTPSILGQRRRWRTRCGRFFIDFFSDGSRDYLCVEICGEQERLVGRRRNLAKAKARCQSLARRNLLTTAH